MLGDEEGCVATDGLCSSHFIRILDHAFHHI